MDIVKLQEVVICQILYYVNVITNTSSIQINNLNQGKLQILLVVIKNITI